MNIFLSLFKFSCLIILLTKPSSANNCTNTTSTGIRPQQYYCGHPGLFNLSCNENNTTIHFPSYGDLVVKSISCDPNRLNLVDPKNCVHEVFLNLNLSVTPQFTYYYALKEYKYINCSGKLTSFDHVPCLSGSSYYVYVVEPSFSVPSSCSCVKTVAIPFSYSRYLSDNNFGLQLTWDSTVRGQHDEQTNWMLYEILLAKKYVQVSCVIAFLLMVGMIFYKTVAPYRKGLEKEKLRDILDEVEVCGFRGEYKTLDP